MAQLLKRTKKSCLKFFRKLTSSAKPPVTKLEGESLGSRRLQKCRVDSETDICQQKIPMRCPYTISAKISNASNKHKQHSNTNRTDNSSQAETKSTNFMVSSQYVSKLETYLTSARQTMNPNILSCDVHGVRSFRLLSEEDTSNEYSTRRVGSSNIVFEKVKYRENIRYFRRTPSNTSLSSYPSSPKTLEYHKEYICGINEKKKESNKKKSFSQNRQSNIFLQFRNNISHPVNLTLSSNPTGNLNNLVISEGRNWLNEPCPVVSWDINGNSIDDDIICLNNNWDDCDNRLNLLRDKHLSKTNRFDGSFKSSSRSSSTTLETWVDDEILDNSYNEEIERQFRI